MWLLECLEHPALWVWLVQNGQKQTKQTEKSSETQEWLFSEIKAIQELALTGWERKKVGDVTNEYV